MGGKALTRQGQKMMLNKIKKGPKTLKMGIKELIIEAPQLILLCSKDKWVVLNKIGIDFNQHFIL